LLPGQAGEGQISVIQAVRQKIEDSNMQLSEMLSRRKVLRAQLSEAMKSGKAWGLIEGGQDNSTDGNLIFQMMERKNELLLKYTENHPIIVSMESEIKLLKKRQDEEEKLSGSSAALAMSSPYVQSIKIQKNEIDTEIATINSRIAAYEKKLKHENDQFNSRLTIETEMANLNRGYETIKKNYLELIDRREQARMSGSVDSEVSALKFKIVDPANMPDKPSSPNRMILYSVVLVFGVLAGLALALSMVFIRPSFVEAKHLRDVTGLPILGTVSEVVSETKAKENRSRLVKFILANVMLFFGYIGVMALEALS
jgi:polysaccharide chain length determinant protein (PEP-CTERM system associated)